VKEEKSPKVKAKLATKIDKHAQLAGKKKARGKDAEEAAPAMPVRLKGPVPIPAAMRQAVSDDDEGDDEEGDAEQKNATPKQDAKKRTYVGSMSIRCCCCYCCDGMLKYSDADMWVRVWRRARTRSGA
jgi:hypothetical protein